jgi:hypothetical protein
MQITCWDLPAKARDARKLLLSRTQQPPGSVGFLPTFHSHVSQPTFDRMLYFSKYVVALALTRLWTGPRDL